MRNIKAAIIHIHGIGSDKQYSHVDMFENLKDNLDHDIVYKAIKYDSRIENNQIEMYDRMPKFKSVECIRKKIFFSFGDAATIKGQDENYLKVMAKIKAWLIQTRREVGDDTPMFFVTHSFGTVLISNFMWDMQKAGIIDSQIKGIFTTGCPLPIFLNGLDKVKSFKKTCDEFIWKNYWNDKDVISYPLGPMSKCHAKLVTDVKVKKGWPVFAHGKYDGDKKVYKDIAKEIEQFIV